MRWKSPRSRSHHQQCRVDTALTKVPLVLRKKETKRILAMAPSTKAHVMLSLAYGCGMRAGEVVRLKVGDIDSAQETIRIVQSKGRKDRNVMLPSDILGLLRAWWTERPTGQDKDDYERWRRRDLSARRFVYIWADGVYFKPRMAEEKQCVLVLIGVDEWGRKEILGLSDGYHESTQSPLLSYELSSSCAKLE